MFNQSNTMNSNKGLGSSMATTGNDRQTSMITGSKKREEEEEKI